MNSKGHCYPKYIILQAVYFKLRFTLCYRDVEEIMKIRGVFVERKNKMIEPGITMFKSFLNWRANF